MDGRAGATGYAVKRATVSGGPYVTVSPAGGVTGTGDTDAGLTDGTTYYYVVTAVGPGGESGNSNEASATPTAASGGSAGPPAPAGLSVTPGDTQLSLAWGAVAGAGGYNLYRAATSGGPYTLVNTAGALTGTSHVDTGLTDGTPYFYVVAAVTSGTEGPRSDEAMGVPVASSGPRGPPAIYGYGADGLRSWKSVGGTTTYFLYDGSLPLCELDGNGNVLATNTWGPDGLLSRNVPAPGQGAPAQGAAASVFYAFDPQGNASLRLDPAGNVLDAFLFDAYGLRTGTDNNTADPYAGFLGQWGGYTDAETGLTLLGQRYYDAGQGRFLTRDPLGYAGGMDLYAYAGDDPVNLADPSGLCADGDNDGLSDADISSMRGLHPGMHAGTAQSNLARAELQGLENTLENAALGPLGEVAAVGDEGIAAEEAAAEEAAEEEEEEMLLAHGTTMERAEGLLKNPPSVDPGFGEPPQPFGAFSTVNARDPDALLYAMQYAMEKGKLYGQGGPAMFFIYVPKAIVGLADTSDLREIHFTEGYGLEELVAAWQQLGKFVTPL